MGNFDDDDEDVQREAKGKEGNDNDVLPLNLFSSFFMDGRRAI